LNEAVPARARAPRPSLGREPAIRQAVAADLPRLAELEAAAFADPWPAGLLASEMAHPGSLVLVAGGGEAGQGDGSGDLGGGGADGDHCGGDEGGDHGGGGRLRGYACFRQGGGEAELLRVAVEPAARGRGLARRLVAAGLERLRAAGVTRCYLEVRSGNASALAVYDAMGFTPCGRRRAYYRDGSDALVLQRDL
jgi:ribosomal-protein-alanine N-acetyltransferase